MVQLPRYRHYRHYRRYRRYCRCQAITTAVLSPLPCYLRHPIATLPPQHHLHGCHAAIDDVPLTPLPPLC